MAQSARSANDRIKNQTPEQAVKHFELDLTFRHLDNWCGDYLFWRSRDTKVIVVGYLCHDNDCSDPLVNCDGMGRIKDSVDFLHHVGRNDVGDPILDDQLKLIHRLRGIDETIVVDEAAIEVAQAMWDEAWAQGKVGTPYAVPLDERHGGGYMEWNRGTIDAVWVSDDALMEHINSFSEGERRIEARKCFESSLDEYNKWATGECFGVVIDVFRRIEKDDLYDRWGKKHEACWGFIGHDHAIESLEEEFESMKEHLTKEKTCLSKPHCPSSALLPMV